MGNTQTIQVANGGNQAIYVMTSGQREHVETISHAFRKAVIDADFNVNRVADARGFTKILPGYSLAFYSGSSGGRVYVSIFSQKNSEAENPGSLELICCAHPWKANEGIVISKDNQIQPVQYGETWIDVAGRDHQRQPGHGNGSNDDD